MKTHPILSLLPMLVLLSTGCADDPTPPANLDPLADNLDMAAALPDSAPALGLLDSVQQRYVRHLDLSILNEEDARAVGEINDKPFLAHASVASSRLANGRVRVASGSKLDLRLPARANDAFQIKDTSSAVALDVSLDGAVASEAESAHGVLVYKDALGKGAHLFHRASENGTEDFVEFSERPDDASLRYTVRLTDEVAGLRLVANTLEFLDAGGAPRLRVSSPYTVDADSVTHDAKLSVEDCAVDTDDSPPWRREPTDPGSRVCHLRVSWDAEMAYPVLVDPSWSTAQTMVKTRFGHTASTVPATTTQNYNFPSGSVFVAGGYTTTGSTGVTGSTEYFDAMTDTWSPGLVMLSPRCYHAASEGIISSASGSTYATYDIILAGGLSSATSPVVATATTERVRIDDTPSAKVTDVAEGLMVNGGRYHFRFVQQIPTTSVTTGAYNLLAIGGQIVTTSNFVTSSMERYASSTGSWTNLAAMSSPRVFHTATSTKVTGSSGVLSQVVVTGGLDNSSTALSTSAIYNPATNTWIGGPALPSAVAHHSASLTNPTKIVVTGGASGSTFSSATTVLNYTAVPGWQSTAGTSMSLPRAFHSSIVLPSGDMLVVAGLSGSGFPLQTQLFTPSSGVWSAGAAFPGVGRYFHTASLVNSKALIAGGYNTTGVPLGDSYYYQ